MMCAIANNQTGFSSKQSLQITPEIFLADRGSQAPIDKLTLMEPAKVALKGITTECIWP